MPWGTPPLKRAVSLYDPLGTLYYATLGAYDPQAGIAVLRLPNAHVCRQVQGRLAAAITTALTQVAGTPIVMQATVGRGSVEPPASPIT